MGRLKRPKGLIRLTSHEAVRTGRAPWLTARVKAYAAVWIVLVASVATVFASRADLDVLILRQPGALYLPLEQGSGANLYNVQMVNRTSGTRQIEFRVTSPAGATVTPLGPVSTIPPHGLVEGRLLVALPVASLAGPSTPVRFEVRADGALVNTVDSAFLRSQTSDGPSGRGDRKEQKP